ncbi:membrane protein [Herbaspirillum rubrisubalbicans]|uniref:ShlB/FhaC/HecB family hemolysin secretion/activation protein n=1 Tax=Herbaspirillum rubrisubalbicans TaxID=80842 RepID=UPI000DC334A2|nr:ShlB/FhaC/HecB family hemolysin secretion/activation protein [Herbaspirillum rubrisubalbicans]RAN42722.1 membrane protein [Herbaspirillum rubrisubalbicans]
MTQGSQGILRGRLRLRRTARVLPIISALLFAGLGPSAWAQAERSAQEFQRQQERERALRQQQERSSDVRLPAQLGAPTEAVPNQESPCFPVHRLVLVGAGSGDFDWLLHTSGADPGGRCLGVQGINALMSRLQNALVARGYVTTRILVAPQDIASGELRLTVVPGKIRTIRFADNANPRGTRWNALPASPGDVLNLRDIEQGLENLKRVPTADADIQIVPSEGKDVVVGDSDLVISYRQSIPIRLTLGVDDSGTKATGKYQGSATVSLDNWLALNDLFYISFSHDLGGGDQGVRGSQSQVLHYSLPMGYWGLAFTNSTSRYHQAVAGINQTYIYSGRSESNELKLSRLVYRDAVRKTTLWIKGFLRASSNYVDDVEVQVQRRRVAGWEMGLAHREFIGEATLDLALAYKRGTGAFDAMAAPEEAFGEGTSRLRLITSDLSLNAPFALPTPWGQQALRYTLGARAQWNRTALTPQDKFSLGGRYTVRGFDGETDLLAERGWYVRNELAAALGQSKQEIYAGLDYGEVGGPSAALLVGRRLAGAVLGLRGALGGVNYEVFAGTPISRPDRFKTAPLTAGMSLTWSY